MKTHQNIHQLTLVRNDHTVLDADLYPYSSNDLHDVASVTKSITALLTGIAIDKGFIKNEEQPVLQFFPEIANHKSILDSLKIKHLITMTAGFACGTTDGEKALSDMRKSNDWVQFIFSLPMTSKPGETFSYCSCNFYLLGEIIQRATHLTPHDFARKYLFGPLQISDSKWLSNDKNINHGWGDLFLYPADMVKIGKLMLDGGRWHGKQIISQQWIEKCLKTISRLNDEKGYGYGWWTYDKGGFYEAAGRGRQTISIIPSKNMVVTMLGGEFDAGAIGKYIFQSIKSDKPLTEDKTSFARLTHRIKQAATAPLTQPELPVSDSILTTLNERTIIFEKNISGIDSLRFSFSKSDGRVIFYKGPVKEQYPFLLSEEKYAISIDPLLRLPVALQAWCKNSREFVLHYNQLCRINNFYFRFIISKEGVTSTLEETSNFIKINIASSFR
jgi:CubicO group peptidase (beta-lactamase class C family)